MCYAFLPISMCYLVVFLRACVLLTPSPKKTVEHSMKPFILHLFEIHFFVILKFSCFVQQTENTTFIYYHIYQNIKPNPLRIQNIHRETGSISGLGSGKAHCIVSYIENLIYERRQCLYITTNTIYSAFVVLSANIHTLLHWANI